MPGARGGDRPPAAAAPGRGRRPRLLGALALALGALLVLAAGSWYALFAWAKSTGRLEAWAVRQPERFQLRWREIRSPLPFVLEADGLALAVRAPRLVWQLDAARARAAIDPFALLDRRFVLRSAAAAGVGLRVATAPRASATAASGEPAPRPAPHGRGRHAPPVDAFRDRPPPAPLAAAAPWSWEVSALEVDDLGEVWIDDLRLSGRAAGSLAFALERRERARIERLRLRFSGTTAALAGETVGERLAGELDLQVAPWRIRGARAAEVVARLQGSAALAGETALAPALRYLFGDRRWLEIGGDRGVVELVLVVDRGRLRAGSRLSAALAEPRLAAFGFAARGSAALDARVAGERDRERLASRLVLSRFTLAREGEAPLFAGAGLAIDAALDAPRLDRPPAAAALTVDLGRGRADDLRFVNELVPASAGVAVERGALELAGALRFAAADRTGAGEIALRGERIQLLVRGQRLAADVALDLRLARPDFAAGSFALDGSKVALTRVSAATSAGGAVESWWGEGELVSGRVTLRRPFASAGELRARCADTRPVVAFYELKRDLPGWAERALLVENVALAGRYRAAPGRLTLRDVRIPFSHGEARAEADLARARRRARLLLTWRQFDFGVELDGAERDLHFVRARDWFERSAGSFNP